MAFFFFSNFSLRLSASAANPGFRPTLEAVEQPWQEAGKLDFLKHFLLLLPSGGVDNLCYFLYHIYGKQGVCHEEE